MIGTFVRKAAAGLLVLTVVGVTALVANGSLPSDTATTGAGEPITSFYIDGEVFAAPPDFEITATFDVGDQSVRMVAKRSEPFSRFILTFGAPEGKSLGIGTYHTAEMSTFEYLSGCGGWNYLQASFAVEQLELTPMSGLSRFAATFEQHCWSGETIFGSFYFNATGVVQHAITYPWNSEFSAPGESNTIELANRGTVEEPIRTEIAGVDASEFEITGNTCGATLAPDSTCLITVRFSPQSSGGDHLDWSPPRGGTRTAELLVYDSTARDERSVLLEGNEVGVANVTLAVNANPVRVGQSVALTVTVDRDVDEVQIWDSDLVVATAPVINRRATVQLSLSQGSHWLIASVTTPTTGRCDSNPLLVVVNP